MASLSRSCASSTRGWTQNCTITPGQQLVVGLAAPLTAPTAAVIPTQTPDVTPTPFSGTTEVCILLFDDLNGDALRQETEFGIDGGAVSLTNLNGSYSQTQNTTSAVDPDLLEPIRSCFTDVPPGQYNVSMAIPDGYNPTMSLSYTFDVKAGDRASVDFGAQSRTLTLDEPAATESGRRSFFGSGHLRSAPPAGRNRAGLLCLSFEPAQKQT
jgi:hypothetical protein